MKMQEILKNKTLKGLCDLYEYEISEVEDDRVKLYDNQLDEDLGWYSREKFVEIFTYDCEQRYENDENIFHLKQAQEMIGLLN